MQGTARQIHSIATHPSQPDKCASGGSNGTIAVWDLRFTSAPLAASTGKQNAADVWQVSYFWEAQAATVWTFVHNQSKSVAYHLMLRDAVTVPSFKMTVLPFNRLSELGVFRDIQSTHSPMDTCHVTTLLGFFDAVHNEHRS